MSKRFPLKSIIKSPAWNRFLLDMTDFSWNKLHLCSIQGSFFSQQQIQDIKLFIQCQVGYSVYISHYFQFSTSIALQNSFIALSAGGNELSNKPDIETVDRWEKSFQCNFWQSKMFFIRGRACCLANGYSQKVKPESPDFRQSAASRYLTNELLWQGFWALITCRGRSWVGVKGSKG